MITVNLRPDLKRKRARSPLQGVTESVRGLGAKVKDPLLLVAVVSWVCVLGWLGFVVVSTGRQLATLEPQLEQTRAEHRRFKAFLTEKRHQEMIRDSLVAQIGVIRSVDGDRYVWSAPARRGHQGAAGLHLAHRPRAPTWLRRPGPLRPRAGPAAAKADSGAAPAKTPVAFSIIGRTVDIQAYTRFLRQLEASPWITDVTPVSAQTVVEKERPVTAFTIRATYREADSAYIRTVPLSQSVR